MIGYAGASIHLDLRRSAPRDSGFPFFLIRVSSVFHPWPAPVFPLSLFSLLHPGPSPAQFRAGIHRVATIEILNELLLGRGKILGDHDLHFGQQVAPFPITAGHAAPFDP